jgi:hypothetical protein
MNPSLKSQVLDVGRLISKLIVAFYVRFNSERTVAKRRSSRPCSIAHPLRMLVEFRVSRIVDEHLWTSGIYNRRDLQWIFKCSPCSLPSIYFIDKSSISTTEFPDPLQIRPAFILHSVLLMTILRKL